MYLALEHFINNPEEEALLHQVDFEKAFDSVELNYEETFNAVLSAKKGIL